MSSETRQSTESDAFVEDVEINGHIIDSLILPKILDCITVAKGRFRIKEISIGQARNDSSFALVEVQADTVERLSEILETIVDHGAVPVANCDCRLVEADIDGAFPEGFYSSTNQRSEVRIDGQWIEVAQQEMDCGVAVDPEKKTAACVPMSEVVKGQWFAVGHAGTKVFPQQRQGATQSFEFMNSAVSTEKPKGVAIRQIARDLFRTRKEGGKTLVVGGPAIVHTGSA